LHLGNFKNSNHLLYSDVTPLEFKITKLNFFPEAVFPPLVARPVAAPAQTPYERPVGGETYSSESTLPGPAVSNIRRTRKTTTSTTAAPKVSTPETDGSGAPGYGDPEFWLNPLILVPGILFVSLGLILCMMWSHTCKKIPLEDEECDLEMGVADIPPAIKVEEDMAEMTQEEAGVILVPSDEVTEEVHGWCSTLLEMKKITEPTAGPSSV
jgi:hypothetical protein